MLSSWVGDSIYGIIEVGITELTLVGLAAMPVQYAVTLFADSK